MKRLRQPRCCVLIVAVVVAAGCLLLLKYESITSNFIDRRGQPTVVTSRPSVVAVPTAVKKTLSSAAATKTTTAPIFNFSASDVYRWNKKLTKPPPYKDRAFLKNCSMDMGRRANLFHMLKYWMKLAAEHNIIWFLTCGTNIGSFRHRDIIPWDHDMDISVLQSDEKIIRKIAVKKHRTMNRNRPNLVVRYGDFCPVNTKRKNCHDEIVNSHVDLCAFCGPLARVIGKNDFMDLFRVRFLHVSGEIRVRDECIDFQTKKAMSRLEDFFPLKPCYFMGLKVLCPRREQVVSKAFYKDFRPPKICQNGRWIKATYKKT